MRPHEYDNHKDVRSHDKIDMHVENVRCKECSKVLSPYERDMLEDICVYCYEDIIDLNHTENDW